MGINETCPCDTTKNETCAQCSACLDQYWMMNGQYKECMQTNRVLEDEIKDTRQELESRRLCALELKTLQECNDKLDRLRQDMDGKSCSEFISRAKRWNMIWENAMWNMAH